MSLIELAIVIVLVVFCAVVFIASGVHELRKYREKKRRQRVRLYETGLL